MGLETVELVLDIEKHFSIDLLDESLGEVETVESLCQLTRNTCVAKYGAKAHSNSYVYQYIVELLHSEFDIPKVIIFPSSRIVKDLGLDQ